MIIEASVSFKGRYKPKRARNWSEAEFRSSTPVRLDEISSDEAPIVCWFSPPGGTPNLQVAIRAHEGRLYQPLIEGTYRPPGPVPLVDGAVRQLETEENKDRSKPHLVDAKRLIAMLEAGGTRVINGALMYAHEHKGLSRRELDAAEYDLSEETKAKAGIQRLMRGFRLIDGIPYSVVEAPLLTFNGNRKIATRHRDGACNVDSYELGDIDRLLIVAGEGAVVWETSQPEILRPDLLPEVDHPLNADIADVVRRILVGPTTGMDPANLGRESLETTLAWLSIRDGRKEGVSSSELLQRLERLTNAASPQLMKPVIERARAVIARDYTLRAHDDLADLSFDGLTP